VNTSSRSRPEATPPRSLLLALGWLLAMGVSLAGGITVRTDVAGFAVLVDGRPAGTVGAGLSLEVSCPPGYHAVTVVRGGFRQSQVVLLGEDPLTVDFSSRPLAQLDTQPPEPAVEGGDAVIIAVLVGVIALFMAVIVGIIAYLWSSRHKGLLFHNHYVIRDVIGRGGMATIYSARDRQAGRQVALKIMDPGLVRDIGLLAKFLREGEVLRMINQKHPQAPIVRVLDFGREGNRPGGRPFIAMELLHGEDLMELIRKQGRVPAGEAVWVVEQVLDALEAAHGEGVYHRDLTPDNIFLTNGKARALKLIDFGVARHEYTSAGTMDGSITGKPPYMSPEQCRGEKTDARSDS